ncbi:putative guanine nucleotide-binding protein alpha-2 subunit [Podospora fimiseda]|uniref:Guanine nucleotide-binding protein alpha-2 subunit n=1 Tax=Podospora fimiseda TaxID=252190 RepID=A0AAN7GSF9_9PEZI|nr:putative guanine nucleotide-binding protein alpha-2 subunit [Podospora fimiseda]
MDPLSIIGGVGSVAGIIDVLGRAIGLISELRDQYKDADFMFRTLESQMILLRIGLEKVGEWARTSPQNTHPELTVQLDSVIDCCKILADRIDDQLDGLSQSGRRLRTIGKLKLALGNRNIDEIQKLLERQTNALTFLLTACNSKSLSEQRDILEQPATKNAVASVKDMSSSMVALFDKASSIRTGWTVETDRMSNISKSFPFDHELLKSKVYGNAVRSALRGRLWRGDKRLRGSAESIAESSVSFNEVKLHHGASINKFQGTRISSISESRDVNILILGPSSSSKTTMLKQIELLWPSKHQGQTRYDRLRWKCTIFRELCRFFSLLLSEAAESVTLSFLAEEYSDLLHSHQLRDLGLEDPMPTEILEALQLIWKVTHWREAALTSQPSPWFDVVYFMNHLTRIFEDGYVPTDQDLLHVSCPSTGILASTFTVNGTQYHVYDAGGNRSERKKWLHPMKKNMDILLFQAPIGSYDEVSLRDDGEMTLMDEVFMLFPSMWSTEWLHGTTKFLNLTKMDMFERKVKSGLSPISEFHSSYTGKLNDVEAGLGYFIDKFTELGFKQDEDNFLTVLDATDTAQVKLLLDKIIHVAQRRQEQWRLTD